MNTLLSSIKNPRDLRQLPVERLPQVAAEIREVIAQRFGLRGEYLRSSLGITDLTLALHYAFDFSHDRLVYDLVYQCAAHLVLTRGLELVPDGADEDPSITVPFPGDEIPPYDNFFAAHAGTSISKALGMAAGRSAPGKTVAVIGDGAVITGVALEALNSGDFLDQDVLVVLNDNEMSISKIVGSMGEYLSKLRVGKPYNDFKRDAQKLIQALPFIGETLERTAEQMKDVVARALVPGYTFEKLGPRYFGPVDGHNIAHLTKLLAEIKRQNGFQLLHVVTSRPTAAANPAVKAPRIEITEDESGLQHFHSETEFEIQGEQRWTDVFAECVLDQAEHDESFSVVVMARPEFDSLRAFTRDFRERFPQRLFDIGVSEQHGLAFAAGLAHEGRRPLVVMPAAFLARGLDQVFQEILLRGLPVTLALVYAGLVDDDATLYHGVQDLAQLRSLPGIDLMAPRDQEELKSMLEFSGTYAGPKAIRIPRTFLPQADRVYPLRSELVRGRGELLRKGSDVAILAYGATVYPAMEAAEGLAERGLEASVVNARFARPFDRELLTSLLAEHSLLFTIEEHGIAGGFGSAALEASALERLDSSRIMPIALPDELPRRGSRIQLLRALGLDPAGLMDRILLEYRRWVRSPKDS
ncbi:MAG: 1-deoxy-D-xylulose-5-phosphate synthase N-terminal domain-containing protein [Planctomycetota bacterium]